MTAVRAWSLKLVKALSTTTAEKAPEPAAARIAVAPHRKAVDPEALLIDLRTCFQKTDCRTDVFLLVVAERGPAAAAFPVAAEIEKQNRDPPRRDRDAASPVKSDLFAPMPWHRMITGVLMDR